MTARRYRDILEKGGKGKTELEKGKKSTDNRRTERGVIQ